MRMLLYVLCTADEFVWNEGGVVPATCYLLPAPYITMCDFSHLFGAFSFSLLVPATQVEAKEEYAG